MNQYDSGSRDFCPQDAVLVLESRTGCGRILRCDRYDQREIVFATGMTGYQETLTDPSYDRQIDCTDVPAHPGHEESTGDPNLQIWVAGCVVPQSRMCSTTGAHRRP